MGTQRVNLRTSLQTSAGRSTEIPQIDMDGPRLPKSGPQLVGVGASTWARRPVKLAKLSVPNGLHALERADYFKHSQALLDQDEEAAHRHGTLSLHKGGPADTEQWRAVRRECLAVAESCG